VGGQEGEALMLWDIVQFRFYTFVGVDRKTGKVEFRTYYRSGYAVSTTADTLGM
jgi:hypothetical protein